MDRHDAPPAVEPAPRQGAGLGALRAQLQVCVDRLTTVLGLAGQLGEHLEGVTEVATYLDPDQTSTQVEAIQAPLALATGSLHELATQVGNARKACEQVTFV